MKVFSHGGPNDLKEYPLWKLAWIWFRGGYKDRDENGELVLVWGWNPLFLLTRQTFSFNEGGRWFTFFVRWVDPFLRLYLCLPGIGKSITFRLEFNGAPTPISFQPEVQEAGQAEPPQRTSIFTQPSQPYYGNAAEYGLSAGGAA